VRLVAWSNLAEPEPPAAVAAVPAEPGGASSRLAKAEADVEVNE
jgi:hypothetical protein